MADTVRLAIAYLALAKSKKENIEDYEFYNSRIKE
jgi:hypothetical protein